jgi:ankyrin repeat protein
MLLSSGADASALSQLGIDKIHKLLRRAIQNSDLATVEMLLDHGPQPILAVDLTGNTPIH